MLSHCWWRQTTNILTFQCCMSISVICTIIFFRYDKSLGLIAVLLTVGTLTHARVFNEGNQSKSIKPKAEFIGGLPFTLLYLCVFITTFYSTFSVIVCVKTLPSHRLLYLFRYRYNKTYNRRKALCLIPVGDRDYTQNTDSPRKYG